MEPELIIDVKPREGQPYESAYILGPFDKALATLRENGFEIISLEQALELRMKEGFDAPICRKGFFVKEGVEFLLRGELRLVQDSPILDNPKRETEFDREEGITRFQYGRRGYDWVHFNRFEEEIVTSTLFGKLAKDYGLFLQEAYQSCKYKPFPRFVPGNFWNLLNTTRLEVDEDTHDFFREYAVERGGDMTCPRIIPFLRVFYGQKMMMSDSYNTKCLNFRQIWLGALDYSPELDLNHFLCFPRFLHDSKLQRWSGVNKSEMNHNLGVRGIRKVEKR